MQAGRLWRLQIERLDLLAMGGGVMKWELKRNPVLPVFQQPKPVHQPRGVCEVEEVVQQLRDELKLGSLKELGEGEEVRRSLSQLESLQQTREVEGAGEGVPAPAAEHTAER